MAQAQSKSGVRVAAPQQQRIAPAFAVKRLEGKVKREVFFYDEKGKRQSKVTEEERGFAVSFSKGHSIRVKNEAELQRLGFDQTIPLVDANDDVHGYLDNDILGANKNDEVIDIDGEM